MYYFPTTFLRLIQNPLKIIKNHREFDIEIFKQQKNSTIYHQVMHSSKRCILQTFKEKKFCNDYKDLHACF